MLPVGFFLSDRFLLGARFDYQKSYSEDYWELERPVGDSDSWSSLRPFMRYYPLAGSDRRWYVFGEIGFGRIGIKGYTGIETDFHVAAGVEYRIGAGVLATARLAYNAFATDLNYTTLEIAPRILASQLSGTTGQPRLTRGTCFTQGPLFRASVGHMRRQGDDWLDYRFEVSPSIGYFPVNGLAVVAEADWNIDGEYDYINRRRYPYWYNNHVLTDFQGSLGLRYYPIRTSRFVPFAGISVGLYRYVYDHEWMDGADTRVKAIGIQGAFGAAYFLSDRLALEARISYSKQDERLQYYNMYEDTWIDTASDRLVAKVGFAVFMGD